MIVIGFEEGKKSKYMYIYLFVYLISIVNFHR